MVDELGFRPLFLTGMFRSGTTLLARALAVHSRMAVAEGPFFQFFKAYRNEVFHAQGYDDFDDESPVGDNFCSLHLDVDRRIRAGSFDEGFRHKSLEQVLAQLRPFVEAYTPEIAPLLSEVRARDYRELLARLLETIATTSDKAPLEVVGFKNAFAEQFVSPFLNAFRDAKVLLLIRDPRAIVASQSRMPSGCYPLLYVVRHWRKSIAYALEHMDRSESFLPVLYERFISEPAGEMKRICEFLGLAFEEATIDAARFTGKQGGQWSQNSSYGTSREITSRFADKWKQVLSDRVVRFVEELCAPELEMLGYARTTEPDLEAALADPPPPEPNLREWIKPYAGQFACNEEELHKERVRRLYLEQTGSDPATLEKLFLVDGFLTRLRDPRLF